MSASSKRYALASIVLVVVTLLTDYVCFAEELRIKPAKPSAEIAQVMQRKQLAQPEIVISQLTLESVTLPIPPSLQTIRASGTVSKANSPTKPQIEQRLKQLVALKGINRTLYFPDSNTPQILAYMHTCVGIDVGGIKNNNLILLSHKNSEHSKIVRAANGYKTPHELGLLAAYAPNQMLVRLYPKWFDERLGQSIATSLGNQSLSQLSGQYAMRGNALWLTNITLNHKPTEHEWLLSQGC